MNITMSREEVQLMLGANNDRMKYLIRHKKLDAELNKHGYTLVGQYKDGRYTFYDLSKIAVDEWEIYQSIKKIKKKEEHTEYVEKRLSPDGLSSPRSKFIRENNIDISETSAMRYDKMMLEEEMMIKDKTVYMLFNPKDQSFKEITKEEYNLFWRDSSECQYHLAHNKLRFKKGLIPESTYESNNFIYLSTLGKEKGSVALKFDTYKEYTNTLNTLDMIKRHKENKKRKHII